MSGLATINEAVDEHRPAHVFGLFSGGHDSLTSTALAASHPLFSGAVHINTGIGIEQTREFVRDTCRQQGWPLHEIRTEHAYEELVLKWGGFPHGVQGHNSMLYYLKQQPLHRWLRGISAARIGLVSGIRKQESLRRARSSIAKPVHRKGRQVWISPILDWSKMDCNRFMETRRLTRNTVVDLLHRSGECLCGALARPDEIHDIARWFPDTARRINDLEHECEARGFVASVWAGKDAGRIPDGQQQMFSKADLAPLCTSCEAINAGVESPGGSE